MKHKITSKSLSSEAYEVVIELFQKNRGKYLEYISQVFWWNKRVNLISRDVSHETMVKHVQHSLLLSVMDEVKNAETILDTGSGGGLPGVPLSMCFPEKTVRVNDIVSKKMMAVKQIARKMGCKNFDIIIGSIASQQIESGELIVSKHAFKVDELIDYLNGNDWSQIIFLKGEKEAYDEIQRVELALNCEIIQLDKTIDDPFYKGKAIVKVKKIDEKL
ncbi:MAG: class I SAM-dependent methyltransferase [Balneolaceae bacterium]|nr:class I SAM-dependent methyltransferase [Balneolaceae bacterium]